MLHICNRFDCCYNCVLNAYVERIFFGPWDGSREVAQLNHISNVVSGGVLTWSVDSFELTEPRLNAPYWI